MLSRERRKHLDPVPRSIRVPIAPLDRCYRSRLLKVNLCTYWPIAKSSSIQQATWNAWPP